MEKLLVVSCVSDDKRSPISMYLMNNKLDDVVSGVNQCATALGAEVLYLLPENTEVSGLDARVAHSITSPTLSNAYAVQQVLLGNLPRPMIQDDFVAVYEDKEIAVITPAEAYLKVNGDGNRFVAVNCCDKTEIIEVKLGTTIGEIADLSAAKAVLVGGLKGEFMLPSQAAETKLEATDLHASITVISEGTCIVDLCAKLMAEIQTASCGKCVLCREGSLQYKQIISEMTTGKAKAGDIALVKEVGELIQIGAYCPFGQNMPKVIISAMELFADEFDEHVKKKSCRCGVCYKAATLYYIDPDECTGCGDCIDECPEDAIEGKDGFIHMIDQDLCEQCGKCVSACDEGCIKTADKLPKLPKKRTKVGKW